MKTHLASRKITRIVLYGFGGLAFFAGLFVLSGHVTGKVVALQSESGSPQWSDQIGSGSVFAACGSSCVANEGDSCVLPAPVNVCGYVQTYGVVQCDGSCTVSPALWAFLGCSPPSAGVCAASHYGCSNGTPANASDNPSSYTWQCLGVSGGSTASCVENKPPVNGVCSATHWGCQAGTAGSGSDNPGSYTWVCAGQNGGTNASCTEYKPPTIDSVHMNASGIVPDGVTQYTITESATDPNGVTDELALINFQGVNAGAYRGYLGWSSNGSFWAWGGSYKSAPIACTGGGSGAIYGGGYGYEYLNLISCSTAVSGNTRSVSYVVSFNTYFTSPVSDNTFSGYAHTGGTGLDAGWLPFTTFGQKLNTFNVYLPPVVSNFTANPAQIYKGQSSKLTWSATNATECHIPGVLAVGGATSGSALVSPTVDTTYQLICTGPGGTATSVATVQVLQPIVTITASPSRVTSGSQTTITWNGDNVSSCTVTKPDGGILSNKKSGSAIVNPTSQSTYTISCIPIGDPSAVVTKKVIVNISLKYAPF